MRLAFACLILAVSLLPLPVRAQDAAQKKQFNALQKSVEARSPEERVAFNALMVSFAGFRDARIGFEICPSAVHCLGVAPAETFALNRGFLALADQPPSPPASQDDLTSADAELNAIYEKVFAALPETCPLHGCLSQTSFRDTQRDWIRYRDAWVTFAKLHWPQTSAETVLTILTRQRTEQLLQIRMAPLS